MYFTDRGIEELLARRGEEEVSLAWLADRLSEFTDVHPEFEVAVERLATWLARRSLVAAADSQFGPAIARADRWLRVASVATVLDASAVVLGLDRSADGDATSQRAKALETLRQGQAQSGGWGPYVTAAPEAFDTALELAGVEHRLITYPNAPHSFFDRKAAAFKQESEGSWAEILGFIRAHN